MTKVITVRLAQNAREDAACDRNELHDLLARALAAKMPLRSGITPERAGMHWQAGPKVVGVSSYQRLWNKNTGSRFRKRT